MSEAPIYKYPFQHTATLTRMSDEGLLDAYYYADADKIIKGDEARALLTGADGNLFRISTALRIVGTKKLLNKAFKEANK